MNVTSPALSVSQWWIQQAQCRRCAHVTVRNPGTRDARVCCTVAVVGEVIPAFEARQPGTKCGPDALLFKAARL